MWFFTSESLPRRRACFPAEPAWKVLSQERPVTPMLTLSAAKGGGTTGISVCMVSARWVEESKQEG